MPPVVDPPVDPAVLQARVVVDEWIRGGVTDAVACPGSRDAPFLLALHAADARGRLRLHVRIDERSAGFLAVGLAAGSGRVVPVVVTSGTAVANLHPAVLEASHAGLKLLVTSADRPVELVGTGANQTIDQVGLFGNAVRATVVLPLAEDRPGAPARWRATVVRALDRAAGTSTADPGPVQLDVPLREPLVPGPDDDGALPPAARGRAGGGPWTRVAAPPAPAPGLAALDLDPAAPTLVVAGHGAPARAGLPPGVPVVAEPTSSLWGGSSPGGPWVLDALAGDGAGMADAERDGLRPRQVVVLGRPTLHRGVSRLLADPRVAVHVVPAVAAGRDRPGWTDVAGTAVGVGALPDPDAWGTDPTWAAAWRAADAAAADAVRAVLADGPGVTGPGLAAAVVAALAPGTLLVPGSSNPVRDVALAAAPRDDVAVAAARGVAGIDGATSFATGAALGAGRSAVALLGDLTFLHDAGGLLVGPGEPRPDLVVVVANDDGGSIFAGLEPGAPHVAGAFERVFATPHGTDLAALCAAHHVPHRRLTDLAGLAGDLRATLAPGRGVRVVEVALDRAGRRALGERLGAAARAAVAGAGPRTGARSGSPAGGPPPGGR